AARARRRIRRLHRRLRPEFRLGLLPDRARVEQAIRECVGEVPGLELLRRWTPRVQQWFAEAPWHHTLLAHGYESAETAPGWETATQPTVTLVPVVEGGRLRRALDLYFRELGMKVVTAAEQLSALGQEGLERLHHGADPAATLVAYLRELGRKTDAVLVPVTAELGGAGDGVQWLASAATALPPVIAFQLEASRRGLRSSLVELGERLTGNAALAATAFDRAFALA
ncbi:MAG: hypothetical protein WAM82_29100, partial [Thermoanaerobaculia bacterium]